MSLPAEVKRNIFEFSGAMKPGDVTLLFTGPSEPRYFLTTWLQTVGVDARKIDPLTPVVVMGLNGDTIGRECARDAIAELKDNPQCIDVAPELIELGLEEAPALLANYPSALKGAIVAIVDLERFRTDAKATKERPVSETVDGTKIRLSEIDELSLPHITEICVEICARAIQHGQRVLLLCRGFGFSGNVPPQLTQLPGLAISQAYPADSDPRLTEEFRALLDAIPTQGTEAAWAWAENNLPPGKPQQLAFANLLSARGQHAAAYQAISAVKQELLDDRSLGTVLQLAQFAAAAGDRAEAARILADESLLPISGLNFEGLRSACVLADDLNARAARDRFRQALFSRFPNDSYSRLEKYRERLDAADYPACRALADQMGSAFRRELANFLEAPVFPPDKLFRAARDSDDLPQALWLAASTAADRGKNAESRALAKELVLDSEFGARAIELRARLLMNEFESMTTGDFCAELCLLLKWVGEHPGELAALFAVEEIFDRSALNTLAVACGSFALADEMKRIFSASKFDALEETVHLLGKWASEGDGLVKPFVEQYFRSKKIVIGVGVVPAEAKPQLTPALLAEVGAVILCSIDRGEAESLPLLAHVAVLGARELNDPNSDLMAASVVCRFLARSNQGQKALDLAMTFLLALPAAQKEHRSWRQSQAWMIYADVYLRLHNPRAALRCALAGLLILHEEPRGKAFADTIRLCARITRDLKIFPLARVFVGMEKEFLKKLPPSRSRQRELEQLDLNLRLLEWEVSDGAALLLEIGHSSLKHLAEAKPDEELAPICAVLANVIRFLDLHGFPPNEEFQTKLAIYLARTEPGVRSKLLGLTQTPTCATLRMLVDEVRSIRSADDLGYALQGVEPVAHAALIAAKRGADFELFWMAAQILSQPAVALRLTELHTHPRGADPVAGTKWLASRIESDSADVVDAVMVQHQLAQVDLKSAQVDLFNVTIAQFRSVVRPEETVVILASDSNGRMFRGLITSAGCGPVEQLTIEEWSPEAFHSWNGKYPATYGREFTYMYDTVVKPAAALVAASVAKLNPLLRVPGQMITIIPDGPHFGFAYLLPGHFSNPDCRYCVAPSTRWLFETRTQPTRAMGPAISWLGSPQSRDEVLVALREGLLPMLRAGGLTESNSDQLPSLADRELVILGSHGQLVEGGTSFSRISDDQHNYEPDQVGAALRGTNCVVLFVCHGGRADQSIFGHSTTGLVSSLLRHGVRCVVAALWPLDVRLAILWTKEFLATDQESTVGERVDLAQTRIARPLRDHPLVRSSFTVFGDGTAKCKVA